ncbi:hypothetical protein IJM86_01845 [bacterium]|nr:hypothetical protein [bacterium]
MLQSLPDGSFDTSQIQMVNNGFFKAFNRSGNLLVLPPGSFKTPNITMIPDDFFD